MLATHPIAANALWLLLVLLLLAFCGNSLSREWPEDVRITFFAFSLSLVVTAIVLFGAVRHGSVDDQGGFVGEGGRLLGRVIAVALDVDFDVAFSVGMLLLVLGPQILSYAFSGLFGCASAPILVGKTVAFSVWSFVKSMALIAGVIMSIAAFSVFLHWASWSNPKLFAAANTALSSLAIALLALIQYRELVTMSHWAKRFSWIARVHEAATRNSKAALRQ